MDISPAGNPIAPWLVAAALLFVLAGGAALLAPRLRNGRPRRPAGEGAEPPGRAPGIDDLPAFREFPPGSAGAPGAPARGGLPGAGWPALAGSGPASTTRTAEAPTGPPARSGQPRTAVLAALVLVSLLLLVAALVLDPAARRARPEPEGGPHRREGAPSAPPVPAPEPGQPGAGELAGVQVPPGRHGGAARLSFGGLVYEQRAVGITVTYPELEVSWNRDEAVAHLLLPTYNCLTATPPVDPVAAGCAPSLIEHADLSAPALELTGDDGAVALSGRFPTYVRPNGSPPLWTGRVYGFSVRAAPVPGAPGGGWVRARGEIRLGDGRAAALDDSEVTVQRDD